MYKIIILFLFICNLAFCQFSREISLSYSTLKSNFADRQGLQNGFIANIVYSFKKSKKLTYYITTGVGYWKSDSSNRSLYNVPLDLGMKLYYYKNLYVKAETGINFTETGIISSNKLDCYWSYCGGIGYELAFKKISIDFIADYQKYWSNTYGINYGLGIKLKL